LTGKTSLPGCMLNRKKVALNYNTKMEIIYLAKRMGSTKKGSFLMAPSGKDKFLIAYSTSNFILTGLLPPVMLMT
jgi:hypothetical protein